MAKDYIKIASQGLDLTYDKGNIVLSYKYNHKTFRYNLLKIDKSLFLPSIPALKFNPSFPQEECNKSVQSINEKLFNLAKAMPQVVAELTEKNPTIKKAAVDDAIARINNIVITPKGFVDDFNSWIEDFKEKKRREDILAGKEPKNIHPTVKDYISTLNLLRDYQHDTYDAPFQLNDITEDFIANLIQYCWDERVDTPEYTYITEGNLCNKSINKRFDCLFTFINQYYKVLPNDIKKPKLEEGIRKIIRLSRAELAQLENLPLDNEREDKVRDYFVFLCYTGLRYSDFVRLDETFYDHETNEITLKATKTSAECKIFLFDQAKAIAEKYSFRFADYTNQALNRALQDLLEKYGLYEEMITMEYMQQGRKTYECHKRELISCHAGRRTYISIMVENGLGLYELMSTTGHKKIDTLKFYIDRFGPDRRNKFEQINKILSNKQ